MRTSRAFTMCFILGSVLALDCIPSLAATGITKFATNALLNSSGSNNSAFGEDALRSNTSGGDNTTGGSQSLYSNTTGYNNMAIGNTAGYSNQTGGGNVSSWLERRLF